MLSKIHLKVYRVYFEIWYGVDKGLAIFYRQQAKLNNNISRQYYYSFIEKLQNNFILYEYLFQNFILS